jgi:predicted Zn-dependent peptidase
LAALTISLAQGIDHAEIEAEVLTKIHSLTVKDITQLVKKTKARMLTSELFDRQSSMRIAAELTEYVSSSSWEAYGDTTATLEAITPKMIYDCIQTSFTNQNMTIGHFIGKA